MENKIEKFLPIDQKDRDLVLPLLLLEKADKPSPGFFSASVDQKKSKKQKNQDKRVKNRLNVCGILFFSFLYFIFFQVCPRVIYYIVDSLIYSPRGSSAGCHLWQKSSRPRWQWGWNLSRNWKSRWKFSLQLEVCLSALSKWQLCQGDVYAFVHLSRQDGIRFLLLHRAFWDVWASVFVCCFD